MQLWEMRHLFFFFTPSNFTSSHVWTRRKGCVYKPTGEAGRLTAFSVNSRNEHRVRKNLLPAETWRDREWWWSKVWKWHMSFFFVFLWEHLEIPCKSSFKSWNWIGLGLVETIAAIHCTQNSKEKFKVDFSEFWSKFVFVFVLGLGTG